MNDQINNLPEQYKPLSPWKYFWIDVLFSLPVIGLVFAIVFSFSRANINRRNFARSYFCALLIGVIVFAAALTIAIVSGATGEFFEKLSEAFNSIR